jgi:CxxC motif-containing protein
MATREMICISCPVGCRLRVESGPSGVVAVEGNQCPRGKIYGESEVKDPRRMVTAPVRLERPADSRSEPAMIPCRTLTAFPKERIPELLAALRALRIRPPVARGRIILADALGTGVDIIATRSLQ